MSGDARRAAHASVRFDPGAGSSHLRELARPRYRIDRITPADFRRRGSVTIDVHGSLDRAKDVSSSAGVLIRRLRDECVRFTHADDVPLLVLPEDTCCRRCVCLHGNKPRYRLHGPTKPHVSPSTREGCRHPVEQGAFHRCDFEH